MKSRNVERMGRQMGNSIDHGFAQWFAHFGFLGDNRLEFDTNLVERAIRPTPIGTKNSSFIGGTVVGQL